MRMGAKLVALIFMVAALFSVVLAVISFFGIKERVNARVEQSVLSVVNTVVGMASSSAYVGDRLIAEEIVAGLQQNEVIRCAAIISDELQVYSADECSGEATIVRQLLSPWQAEDQIGELKVYKSRAYIDAIVHEQFQSALITLLVVIVVMCVAVLILTYALITYPISRLARKLGEVDFGESIPLLYDAKRSDEIGHISRIINMMIANAQKQIVKERMLAGKARELSNHFRLIFQLSKNNLAVTDGELKLKSFNPRFEQMVATALPKTRLHNSNDWLNAVTENPEGLRQAVINVDIFEVPETVEVEAHVQHGRRNVIKFYSLTFVKSEAEDGGVTILFFIYDMTEHRKQLALTEYEANHDNLTKLLNRRASIKIVRHMLSSRAMQHQVAVLVIDLDGFKPINDTFGHETGDYILKAISGRIKNCVRNSDVCCRWGGDEFLVALNDVTLAQANSRAHKILDAIVQPISIDGYDDPCKVGASIGLSLSTDDVGDFQTLFDHADKAMYRVKKTSKNAVLVHAL